MWSKKKERKRQRPEGDLVANVVDGATILTPPGITLNWPVQPSVQRRYWKPTWVDNVLTFSGRRASKDIEELVMNAKDFQCSLTRIVATGHPQICQQAQASPLFQDEIGQLKEWRLAQLDTRPRV